MRITERYYACDFAAPDGRSCLSVSSPGKHWDEARALAERRGWWIGPHNAAICPTHRETP